MVVVVPQMWVLMEEVKSCDFSLPSHNRCWSVVRPPEHGDSCWRHSYILQLARPEWGRNESGMTLAMAFLRKVISVAHLWVADSLVRYPPLKFFSHHSQSQDQLSR